MNCAIIENGVVKNIIAIAPWNLSEFPDAFQLDGRSIAIGDEYHDNGFWRNGALILTPDEILRRDVISAQQQLTDADLAQIEAQQQITDLLLQLQEMQL